MWITLKRVNIYQLNYIEFNYLINHNLETVKRVIINTVLRLYKKAEYKKRIIKIQQ
jgi:hypothetical protein